jgi:putative transposase
MKKKREENPMVNQVLTPEFLKQFKDSGELNSFMATSMLVLWSK